MTSLGGRMIELGGVVRVAFLLELLPGDKADGGGIDAVAQTGGSGAVIEDVAEVGIALRRADLGAVHAVGGIGFFGDGRGVDRPGEAGPAGAGIELVGGAEEGLAGDDINVDACLFVVPVGVEVGGGSVPDCCVT